MINVDKILGGIVQGVVSSALSQVVSKRTARQTGMKLGRAVSKVDKRAVGIGALGIAIATYEHFKERPSSAVTTQGTGATRPPPPPPGSPRVSPPVIGHATPPPCPPSALHSAPPLPPSEEYSVEGSPQSLLLLRTMIAAASADGAIDLEEQRAIIESLDDVGLSSEERRFIEDEFTKPRAIETLVAEVTTPEMARQMFTVALIAIHVDENSERDFMTKFQKLLRIDTVTADEIRHLVR